VGKGDAALVDQRDACGRNVEQGKRLAEADMLLLALLGDDKVALDIAWLGRHGRTRHEWK
jgi:hypothetical protein